MACSHCGAALARTLGTCPSCGAPITPAQRTILEQSAARRRARWRWAVSLVLVLAAATGLGVRRYFFSPPPFVPIEATSNPAAASVHIAKVYDEPYAGYDGQ